MPEKNPAILAETIGLSRSYCYEVIKKAEEETNSELSGKELYEPLKTAWTARREGKRYVISTHRGQADNPEAFGKTGWVCCNLGKPFKDILRGPESTFGVEGFLVFLFNPSKNFLKTCNKP